MQHKIVLKIKQRVINVECYAKFNSCAELFAQEFEIGSMLENHPEKCAMQNFEAK